MRVTMCLDHTAAAVYLLKSATFAEFTEAHCSRNFGTLSYLVYYYELAEASGLHTSSHSAKSAAFVEFTGVNMLAPIPVCIY